MAAAPDLIRPKGALGDALNSAVLTEAARPAQAGRNARLQALLKRAVGALAIHDYKAAATHALKAVDLDEESPVAAHVLAIALDKGGFALEAIEMYERALARAPHDAEIYQNLGMLAWKLKMLPTAEQLFSTALRVRPGWHVAQVNHANIVRDQGRFEEAAELLKTATLGAPHEPDLWNALGAAAIELGKLDEPIAFFLEALRLDPSYVRAHHNIAHALIEADRPEEAVDHYRTALEALNDPAERAECEHSMALALLAAGRVQQGWAAYRVRRNPRFSQNTQFMTGDLPAWAGEDIAGKKIVAFGEQGLGDEILFGTALPDLIDAVGPDGKVLIACQPRLQTLFARSFPEAEVVGHGTVKSGYQVMRGVTDPELLRGFDRHTVFGDVAAHFRPNAGAFPMDARPLLTPDPARVAHWSAWLSSLGPGLKVGLCWTSLLATGTRARNYSPFSAWGDILRTPGARFICLQYGEVSDALAHARDVFGVEIAVPPGLDLKDDLDDLAALCAAIDLVIGAMNATLNIAAGVGAEVWALHKVRKAWSQLGAGRLPWYPTATVYAKDPHDPWDGLLSRVCADLTARAAAASV
jgi:tetratricopeptide (TPR) repeat protein